MNAQQVEQSMVAAPQRSLSVIADMAERFGMDRRAFEATIKATLMPANTQPSDEQIVAFLLVAKKYNLNPFTKEIFAFPSRGGGIQPIVSIDGWLKIINDHPQFDGMEFDDRIDDKGSLVAVTCKIFRKDRSRPVEVTEYMSECRRSTDTWKQWPARMLRHKAAIQAARYAFGFSGILDPDEAERVESVTITAHTAISMPRAKSDTPKASTHAPTDAEPPVVRNDEPGQSTEAQEPGIHGLSESMERILLEAARQAHITRDQLLERHPRIDTSNFAAIRAELKDMASAG